MAAALAAVVTAHGCAAESPAATSLAAAVTAIKPVVATATLPDDPDDPAIWVNAADPGASLLFGTVKVAAPVGALAVFNLDGSIRQMIGNLDRPNNVDVEYGLDLDATPTDIAVVTERLGRKLRVFGIPPSGALREITGSKAITLDAPGDQGAPMGVALYRRPRDGAIFAIVAPKAGPKSGYLAQFRLADDGTGRVGGALVRHFGDFSGSGEIEAVTVDDELGFVYYADEASGIHKWHADPDAPGAERELALFATNGYKQDREGLAIYQTGAGTGYIVSVDQLPGDSIVHLYKREGEPGRPHDHSAIVSSFRLGADGTDGLDATSTALGARFPNGLLIIMNSSARNFLITDWRDIAKAAALR